MGKRVHVVSKREEYGNREAFNWCHVEFHALLDLLGCDVASEEEWSDRFECPIEAYKKALEALKSYKKHGMQSRKMKALMEEFDFSEEELLERVNNLGDEEKILDYIVDVMQDFWKERDKKSGWISFLAW